MAPPARRELEIRPTIWQIDRELKLLGTGLYECLASIHADTTGFVEEMRLLYPTLPCVANLRCGLWYQRDPDGPTCYFKSTGARWARP